MTEENKPDPNKVEGPKSILTKIKQCEGITVNRAKITDTSSIPKSMQDLEAKKRATAAKKAANETDIFLSNWNLCQTIVDLCGQKLDTAKHNGIQTALLTTLFSQTSQSETPLIPMKTKYEKLKAYQERQLIFSKVKLKDLPAEMRDKVKVVTVEFAGLKFKYMKKDGIGFVDFTAKSLVSPILRAFKSCRRVVLCEEKYSFTPDALKAATRKKRKATGKKKKKKDVAFTGHLKQRDQILSKQKYDKTTLTATSEGKNVISTWVAENIDKLPVFRDVTTDVDSELVMEGCACDGAGEACFAVPIRTTFSSDSFLGKHQMDRIHQRKGEAEAAVIDWLIDGDAVLS